MSGVTAAGGCGMLTHTHPDVAGAFWLHGWAGGGLGAAIEAQASIGFRGRKATVKIAKPNFILALMVSFQRCYSHVACHAE